MPKIGLPTDQTTRRVLLEALTVTVGFAGGQLETSSARNSLLFITRQILNPRAQSAHPQKLEDTIRKLPNAVPCSVPVGARQQFSQPLVEREAVNDVHRDVTDHSRSLACSLFFLCARFALPISFFFLLPILTQSLLF